MYFLSQNSMPFCYAECDMVWWSVQLLMAGMHTPHDGVSRNFFLAQCGTWNPLFFSVQCNGQIVGLNFILDPNKEGSGLGLGAGLGLPWNFCTYVSLSSSKAALGLPEHVAHSVSSNINSCWISGLSVERAIVFLGQWGKCEVKANFLSVTLHTKNKWVPGAALS